MTGARASAWCWNSDDAPRYETALELALAKIDEAQAWPVSSIRMRTLAANASTANNDVLRTTVKR